MLGTCRTVNRALDNSVSQQTITTTLKTDDAGVAIHGKVIKTGG